jgi:hypothetical protein
MASTVALAPAGARAAEEEVSFAAVAVAVAGVTDNGVPMVDSRAMKS